jgi:hypothetical protein
MPLIHDTDAAHSAARAACMHARERGLIHAKGPVDLGEDLGLWYPVGVRTFARHVRDLLDQVQQSGVKIPPKVREAIEAILPTEDVVYLQVPETEIAQMIWMLAASYFGSEGVTHFRYRDGMVPDDPRRFRPGQPTS